MDIETNQSYLEHPKVVQARQFLRDAYFEVFNKAKQKANSQICECGHRHDQHAPSISINYSAGRCVAVANCNCLHFLIKGSK